MSSPLIRIVLPVALLAPVFAQDPAGLRPPAVESVVGDARNASVRPDQYLVGGVPMLPLPTTVLFDRPYPGELWALGSTWKASFSPQGITYIPYFGASAPRNFPIEMTLRSATVGGAPLPFQDGTPVTVGDQVRLDRGSFVEVYDLGLEAVEQSFVFRELPMRGTLTVEIGVASELVASAIPDGLRFGGDAGHVDYTKAVAIDARGRRLPLAIEWLGDGVRIAIPASFVEQAELPLVLDPILNTSGPLAPTTSAQRHPDVATLQSPDRILVTWQRTWSIGDEDCFTAVYDTAWTLLSPVQVVDLTVQNWTRPRAASNKRDNNWLIVAQVNFGSNYWVAGRIVSSSYVLSPNIDIERAGVVGLPGNTYSPDVGGDPYTGGGAVNYCVVFVKETTPSNTDIYFKLVRPDGTLPNATPTVLANTLTNESAPSISKSNQTYRWMVVWQRQYPFSPFDQDVHGVFVSWNGSIPVPSFLIAGTAAEDLTPSASSPAIIATLGYHYLVAFAQAPTISAQADIICQLYDTTGAPVPIPALNLSQTSASGAFAARDQIRPRVESDGVRFAVAYDEFDPAAFEFYTFLDTIGAPVTSGTIGALQINDERVATNFVNGNLASLHSGGMQASPVYAIAGWSPFAPHTISAHTYGGYQPGWQFSIFGSQCGALPISYSGSPTIGGQVTISVPHTGASGMVLGTPGFIPLSGLLPNCNCLLGVANGILTSNPLVFNIPPNSAFVGLYLSAQGYSAGGTSCMSFLDLSNTVDFTIR
jgi:hypothetical protein